MGAADAPDPPIGEFPASESYRPAPWLAGAVAPEPVGRAVIRALRRNPQEIIVCSMPTRPLLALAELWPELGDVMLKTMGVVAFQRKLVSHHGEAA